MTFTCPFCGKEYKTERGFQNHKCVYKDRVLSFNDYTLKLWQTVYNVYRFKLPTKLEEQLMAFAHNKSYNDINKFVVWVIETKPLDFLNYLQFLKQEQIAINRWTNERVYHSWLNKYLNNESLALATERANNYINTYGAIETMSGMRLYTAIKYGYFSKKYLKSIGWTPQMVKEKIDYEPNWRDIRYMLMDSFSIESEYGL